MTTHLQRTALPINARSGGRMKLTTTIRGWLGWADAPPLVWFRCSNCGEGFVADGLLVRPVHGADHDGWVCQGVGTRMRTPS